MLELEFLEIARQRLVFSANFRNHPGLLFRRLLSGEFLEDFQIGRPGFQGQEWLDLGTKLGNQLDIGLRELLLFQKSGDAMRASTSARRRVRAEKSKKPPQLGEACRDGGGIDGFELFNHCQRVRVWN